MTAWNEADIQRYIDDEIEESLTLEYKAADALAKGDGKKTEITKDVSAMANSTGGIIIYGIREYSDPTKKHLPETITPINRTLFSKEWLEQVINNIRPRIDKISIHPVSLSSGANDVAYVVEIPQSQTAHQATDHRYYKRFNFMSVAMEDYEIRDIMNRLTVPNVIIKFTFSDVSISSDEHIYLLEPIFKNLGTQVVNNFKLKFTIPLFVDMRRNPRTSNVHFLNDSKGNHVAIYQSMAVLFPDEEFNIGYELQHEYVINHHTHNSIDFPDKNGHLASLKWILYADNMPPKIGEVPLLDIQRF